jgi:uncharacterized protein involved in response to NO
MSAETAGISRDKPFGGPQIFRQGFRPFFLSAGFWAVANIILWLAVVQDLIAIPTAFAPVAWHAHEMIFGYAGAVVAGFLLTAIPNWTGRMPVQGLPLVVLFGTWLAGRAAMASSALIEADLAAALDLSFFAVLLAIVLREILAGRNWRNLPMPAAVSGLLLANILTHAEAVGGASTGTLGLRLAIAIIILLISLVGGRIIPSFTRNWLMKRSDVSRSGARLPAAFDGFDRACLVATLAALGAWVAAPEAKATGAVLLIAGVAAALRLARWCGHRTFREPLVWSLHLGFAWVPAGLCLLGLGVFFSTLFPSMAGLHALTVGAIGSVTLAVMTRATLGHSGQALAADGWTGAIYVLIAAAAGLRVMASLLPDAYGLLLWVSGFAWIAAFSLFISCFGRILIAR